MSFNYCFLIKNKIWNCLYFYVNFLNIFSKLKYSEWWKDSSLENISLTINHIVMEYCIKLRWYFYKVDSIYVTLNIFFMFSCKIIVENHYENFYFTFKTLICKYNLIKKSTTPPIRELSPTSLLREPALGSLLGSDETRHLLMCMIVQKIKY